MNYQIYRLCRNENVIQRLKQTEATYKLPKSNYLTGIDLFKFINLVIKECPTDYALVVHEDVILPETIDDSVNNAIKDSDAYFGSGNWGVIGNAGVEFLSKKVLTYISDPHTYTLPPKTKHPHIVESIDGNTMLLNIKAIRKNSITLPDYLVGYHLYDLILCTQCYINNLACGVSSWLYTKHLSAGNYQSFKEAIKEKQFQKYFSENFNNHTITSLNDTIPIKSNDNGDLFKETVGKKSFEEIIKDCINKIFIPKNINLNIIIRIHKESPKLSRLLESLRIFQLKLQPHNRLTIHLAINNISENKIAKYITKLKNFSKPLNLKIHFTNSSERYPRVASIGEVVEKLALEENSYTWIVDYDDFVMPELANDINFLLYDNEMVVGDTYIFSEQWGDKDYPLISSFDHKIESFNIKDILTGKNFMPICSIIYKSEILKDIFASKNLRGDYFEDYALVLLAAKTSAVQSYPLPFCGVSYHGDNTVLEEDRTHWDYSYTTFLSEIINNGLLEQNVYDFINSTKDPSFAEFQGFKNGLIWKYLNKYRRIKNMLKSFIKGKHE